MANPVTLTDIEARWRPLTSEEQVVTQSLLDDAWVVLTTRVPSVPQRLTDATLDTSLVVAVVSAMVLRVLRNPDGKVQESIDDYTYRRADAVSDGALYVSADEMALLSPAAVSSAAFTIRPFGEPGYRVESSLDWS